MPRPLKRARVDAQQSLATGGLHRQPDYSNPNDFRAGVGFKRRCIATMQPASSATRPRELSVGREPRMTVCGSHSVTLSLIRTLDMLSSVRKTLSFAVAGAGFDSRHGLTVTCAVAVCPWPSLIV